MISSSLHVNPFPGIRSYEIYEDELFFGRELQVRELIDKLSGTRFLTIVGSSGCGKSSLIKAGLIPALIKNKTHKISSDWDLTIFRPGDNPMGNLAQALARDGQSVESIALVLRSGPDGLIRVLKEQRKANDHAFLLIVDQFEELFRYKNTRTSVASNTEASTFVELLLYAINQTALPVFIVQSMRTDFLDDCTEFRGLSEVINQGYYLVPRMNMEERRLAITGPIQFKGARISEDLVERLLNDVGDDPDQLPIMQHALMRTWDYWTLNRIGDQPIGMEHYSAIGTMNEALSVHLEEIYNELKDYKSKFIAEKLFKALTDVSKESRGTRRPTKLNEICTLAEAREAEVIRVIDNFRETGRAFLMPSRQFSLQGDSTIDISHESIMRVWTRLRKWVEEESQSAQLYLRLSKSSELFQAGKSGLWVNPELQLALQWKEQNKPNSTWAMRYDPAFDRAMTFLEYSKKQNELEISKKENQQKRNLKRARSFAFILGIASVISILFLIISLDLRFKAEASRKQAMEKEKQAIFEQKKTEEQRKEAILQKKISEQQQQIAEQQKIITEQQRQYAVKQQGIAQFQTVMAIEQKQKAVEARQEALIARDEAEEQRKEAISQKVIADKERIKAEESEKNTQRLRLLSIARSMAIQASQLSGSMKSDLPAILAVQAYRFNAENGGDKNDPDIYNALSSIVNDQIILRAHDDGVRSMVLTPDGKTLFSCGDDGKVVLWKITQPGVQPIFLNTANRGIEGIRSLGLTNDTRYLVAGTVSGKVLIWKMNNWTAAPVILNGHSSVVNSLVVHPTRKLFATAGSDGKVILWNYEYDDFRKSILDSLNTKVSAIAFSPDGKYLAIGGANGLLKITEVSADGNAPIILLPSGNGILSLTFNPKGKEMAAGFSDGVIRIWNSGNFSLPPAEIIGRHSSGVTSLAFSFNGQLLASASFDRTLNFGGFNSNDEKPISIEKNELWVYDVLFTPDNLKVISCSADKTIRLFPTECSTMADQLKLSLKRNMTAEEWNSYVSPDIPYEKSLNHLP